MYFMAHVREFTSEEGDTQEVRMLLFADSYADAAGKLEEYFDKDLDAITLLTAFTDNPVVCVDEDAENAILHDESNDF